MLTKETVAVEAAKNENFVYYGMAVRDYENFAEDWADIIRWAKEMTWRLEYYRDQP